MEQSKLAKIRAIQARNYRCLRHVDVRLDDSFYVVVGPNGSGKSTLFDAIEFLFDLFNGGLKAAIETRTQNFQDLVWARPQENPGFELAAEFDVLDETFRYEVKVEERSGHGVRIVGEAGYLGGLSEEGFANLASSDTIFSNVTREDLRPVFRRIRRGRTEEYWTTFHSERDGETITLHHPDDTSAIRYVELVDQLPAQNGRRQKRRRFHMPVATATTTQLNEKRTVQFLQLDSRALRRPAARNGDDGSRLTEDGSNLPRVVDNLARDKARWNDWMDHIRTVLPSIRNIRSVHREEERSDYLMIRYANGVEVPAWGISEGTLRLLALTIIAYLPDEQPAAYLLEEPENGIHPMAIEMSHESLSSIYRSQVFIASHSPTFLRCVKPREVLCFSQDEDGGTVIVRGDDHPTLSDWQGSTDDDLFFAPDVLG
ncbi:MAG: AAA family ATPase [Gammaproteobacteria bacterium]|nr:AAA family ATPase [Gammaproteobacteria bacterium]